MLAIPHDHGCHLPVHAVLVSQVPQVLADGCPVALLLLHGAVGQSSWHSVDIFRAVEMMGARLRTLSSNQQEDTPYVAPKAVKSLICSDQSMLRSENLDGCQNTSA